MEYGRKSTWYKNKYNSLYAFHEKGCGCAKYIKYTRHFIKNQLILHQVLNISKWAIFQQFATFTLCIQTHGWPWQFQVSEWESERASKRVCVVAYKSAHVNVVIHIHTHTYTCVCHVIITYTSESTPSLTKGRCWLYNLQDTTNLINKKLINMKINTETWGHTFGSPISGDGNNNPTKGT